jgi:hypothetical protein
MELMARMLVQLARGNRKSIEMREARDERR